MRIKNILSFTLIIILLFSIFEPMEVHGNSMFPIRPPFSGYYPVSSYFDHYYPAYAADPDGMVAIYTGQTTNNQTPFYYRGHSGWDYATPTGTPILATADGNIRFIQRDDLGGYGIYVDIDHHNGFFHDMVI